MRRHCPARSFLPTSPQVWSIVCHSGKRWKFCYEPQTQCKQNLYHVASELLWPLKRDTYFLTYIFCSKFDTVWIKRNLSNNGICADQIKFVFSKKPTKTDKIFTVDLLYNVKCQICGLLKKHDFYRPRSFDQVGHENTHASNENKHFFMPFPTLILAPLIFRPSYSPVLEWHTV